MNKSKNCWTVYCHTTPSGKRYIGITSQKPEKRWQNGKGYRKNKPFSKAIEKYKWENIKHEILDTNLDEFTAKCLEEYYIFSFSTFVGFSECNGYNLTLGGEGVLGHVTTEETRRKQSEAKKGKQFSEEHKLRLSESHKGKTSNRKGKKTGKPAWNRGISPSEDSKIKMSKSKKGKHLSEVHKLRLSESHKGKQHNEETKKILSEKHKGDKNPMYGKPAPIKGKHRVIIDGKRHYE